MSSPTPTPPILITNTDVSSSVDDLAAHHSYHHHHYNNNNNNHTPTTTSIINQDDATEDDAITSRSIELSLITHNLQLPPPPSDQQQRQQQQHHTPSSYISSPMMNHENQHDDEGVVTPMMTHETSRYLEESTNHHHHHHGGKNSRMTRVSSSLSSVVYTPVTRSDKYIEDSFAALKTSVKSNDPLLSTDRKLNQQQQQQQQQQQRENKKVDNDSKNDHVNGEDENLGYKHEMDAVMSAEQNEKANEVNEGEVKNNASTYIMDGDAMKHNVHLSYGSMISDQQQANNEKEKQQQQLLGLSTPMAKEQFIKDIQLTIEYLETGIGSFLSLFLQTLFHNFISKPLSGGLNILLLVISLLCLITACVLKWCHIPYRRVDPLEAIRILVECVLVFVAIVIVCGVNMERHVRKKKVYVRLLQRRFQQMLKNGFEFTIKRKNGDIFEGINLIPYRIVFVYRDDKWIKLPHILLVSGDYVYSPLPKNDFEVNTIKYRSTNRPCFFIIEETPMCTLLRSYLPNLQSTQNKVPLYAKMDYYSRVFSVLALISFLIVMLFNVVRVAARFGNNDWVLLLLMQPIYVTLLLLPVGMPLAWLIFNVIIKARIASVFSVLTASSSGLTRREQYSCMEPDKKHKPVPIPISSFMKNFFRILLHKALSYDSVLALGSVTALCFVNKNGVLADLLYAPEKLLLITTGNNAEVNDDSEAVRPGIDDYGVENTMPETVYLDGGMVDDYQDGYNNDNYGQYDVDGGQDGFIQDNYERNPDDTNYESEVIYDGAVEQNDEQIVTHSEFYEEHQHVNQEDALDTDFGFQPQENLEYENQHGNEEALEQYEQDFNPEQGMIDHGEIGQNFDHEMENEGAYLLDPNDPNAEIPQSPTPSDCSRLFGPNYVTLDLMFDRETSDESCVIKFEDTDWRRHLDLLKPLGLNFLITGRSKLPDFDQVEGMIDAKSHLWQKYVYLLGKEIGFSDDVLESFSFRKRIHTQRGKREMSSVIVEYEGSGMQIQSFGHPDLLVDYCSDFWDGSDIRPITQGVKNHIQHTFTQWSKRRDLYVLAIAYKPIDNKYSTLIVQHQSEDVINIRDADANFDANLDDNVNAATDMDNDGVKTDSNIDSVRQDNKTPAQKFNAMQCGQIFLGMAAFRQQPKANLPDFIRDLENDSGIRFIFFSTHNSQKTKAFGAKLGMETDWNSCISLAENEVDLDESDLRARLPHGIAGIREHIKMTDNVPLLVSLFSDATPESTSQMVSILQENHEVVCCVGSSIAVDNIPVLTQSNVCISVDPSSEQHMSSMNNIYDANGQQEENDFQEDYSSLFSFPSAFQIKSNPQNEQLTATFPILFHLIKEGRRNIANLKQALLFLMCSNLCLLTIQVLSQMVFLPSTIFTGVQCLWMMFVILPLFSLALMGNPIEPKIMDTISSKNILNKGKSFRLFLHNYLRFLLPIPIAFVVYVWTLFSMRPAVGVNWKIFGTGVRQSTGLYRTHEFLAAVTYAQNITLFVVVFYLIFISICFLHRVYSIFTVRLYRNILWMVVMPLILILQFIFSFVACISVQHHLSPVKFPHYPFYAYLIVLLPPPIVVLIDELAKIRMRKKYFTQQKRLKLQFGTKLGMYSPR